MKWMRKLFCWKWDLMEYLHCVCLKRGTITMWDCPLHCRIWHSWPMGTNNGSPPHHFINKNVLRDWNPWIPFLMSDFFFSVRDLLVTFVFNTEKVASDEVPWLNKNFCQRSSYIVSWSNGHYFFSFFFPF